MAIIISSASLVSTFSDVGVWPAIIQNPRGATTPYLNAAWWLGLLRGALMYIAIFICAPWVAHFYADPQLSPLLRVALLSVIFDALLSPRSKLSQKEMQFDRWAFISNGGGICGVALTIGLSFALRSVWALAIGFCAENAFRCLLSYIAYPGLPSFGWDRHALRDILKFAKGMVGLSFLNLLFARTDIFVLGKLHSAGELGLYALAVNLVQTPAAFLIAMLTQTLLPVLSHVQDDLERMNRILVEVTSWMILLGLPAVATVWICGRSLLVLFYGPQYGVLPVAEALSLAALVGLLNSLNSLITVLFFATGSPGLHRRAVAASAIIMVAVIYPSCKLLGLPGGQLAALIAIIGSYLLQVARMRGISGLKLARYGATFLPALLISLGVLSIGAFENILGIAAAPLVNIGVSVLACLLAYICCAPLMKRLWAANRALLVGVE